MQQQQQQQQQQPQPEQQQQKNTRKQEQSKSPVVECNAQAPAGPPDSQKGGKPLQIPEVLSCLFLGLTLLKKTLDHHTINL